MRLAVSLSRFLSPCFVFRPDIFARACWRKLRARPERCVVQTAWGDWLQVEPRKFVGAHVYMRGVHELPVCEVLWRLARAGECVVDVGANIGVMTSLLSRRVGERGRVLSFEAHPVLFRQLQENVGRWHRPQVEMFNQAISSLSGAVAVHEGDGFASNEGTARLVDARSRRREEAHFRGVPSPFGPPPYVGGYVTTRCLDVESVTLDKLIPATGCGVVKIDVEGHEFEVLSGAVVALAAHRLRNVVFESTWSFPGPAHALLREHGYHLFAIEASLRGPRLAAVSRRSGPENRQADYLATVDPSRAAALVEMPGWRALAALHSNLQ
jgi:FkbM family methyltransferase